MQTRFIELLKVKVKLKRKLIAQLELEEDGIEELGDMEVADLQESATTQAIQETTVADQQEKEMKKATIIYPDIYASAGDKDNPYYNGWTEPCQRYRNQTVLRMGRRS